MNLEQVTTAAKNLPPEFDLDQLIEKLRFIEKINKALEEVETGPWYTTEEVLEGLKKR